MKARYLPRGIRGGLAISPGELNLSISSSLFNPLNKTISKVYLSYSKGENLLENRAVHRFENVFEVYEYYVADGLEREPSHVAGWRVAQ